HGKIIAEGTPSQLRARLADRVLELRGSPLRLLRHIAQQDADVEDVRAFGDRLHLRVAPYKGDAVLKRLPSVVTAQGCQLDEFRLVPPVLEDIFIELSEQTHE
ncbi:MAG: ATP-binding protein DrrA1-3 family domain-containing protein, partial [Anaerolineales bacterium]